MTPFRILPSTTSHKHEALLPTLEVFARLGFTDIDLNLNHLVERGTDPAAVQRMLDSLGQRVWIASGGWCDFFDQDEAADRTQRSVDRQVALTRAFGVDRLRLFFGRLPYGRYTPTALAVAVANIQQLADRHRGITFLFENHDGASSRPDVCRAVLEGVDRPNVRMTFDAINFELRGVRTMDALAALLPLVGHVHLKGCADGEPCGFAEGEVDLAPALRMLVSGGYRGDFTVEYEGRGDRTLRLYESVRRARQTLATLLGPV